MGFECRCGGVFCGAHRYSDRHDCGFDYRGVGRDAIARANPRRQGRQAGRQALSSAGAFSMVLLRVVGCLIEAFTCCNRVFAR
jgi:hypothetical protein